MEFKAEEINGEVFVKAIAEKKPNGDIIMHIPSFSLIQKLKTEFKKDGLRNI